MKAWTIYVAYEPLSNSERNWNFWIEVETKGWFIILDYDKRIITLPNYTNDYESILI